MPVEANDRPPASHARGFSSRMPAGARRTGRWRPARGLGGAVSGLLTAVIPAAAILMTLGATAGAQPLLSAEEIQDRIVGHRFRGKKGVLSVAVEYSADGTVTIQSPLGAGTGRWAMADNQLCVRIETGPRKADECLTFTPEPDGVYRASNGMRLIPAE